MPISAQVSRRTLLKQRGNRCQSCGISDGALEIAHIVPIGNGGVYELRNIALLCRACHQLLQTYRPTWFEFERFLSDILERSPKFAGVAFGNELKSIKGMRPGTDMTSTRLKDGKRETVMIEAKISPSLRKGQVQDVIHRFGQYRDAVPIDVAALAFPGRLIDDDHAALEEASIEVWDIDYVAETFAKEIDALPFSGLKQLYLLVPDSTSCRQADILSMRLRNCLPGAEWVAYQKLIRNIFELLFVPPLMPPIDELFDASRANRRDIILPNYATDGFWKFMRETYNAHYIVVDPKNWKDKIKKSKALQLANYLKPHGTGMFGIIVTRKGATAGCRQTIREQWGFQRKMILIFTDEDIQRMLRFAGSNNKPEDFIAETIQAFRLSM